MGLISTEAVRRQAFNARKKLKFPIDIIPVNWYKKKTQSPKE
jgi:hypothetical protein